MDSLPERFSTDTQTAFPYPESYTGYQLDPAYWLFDRHSWQWLDQSLLQRAPCFPPPPSTNIACCSDIQVLNCYQSMVPEQGMSIDAWYYENFEPQHDVLHDQAPLEDAPHHSTLLAPVVPTTGYPPFDQHPMAQQSALQGHGYGYNLALTFASHDSRHSCCKRDEVCFDENSHFLASMVSMIGTSPCMWEDRCDATLNEDRTVTRHHLQAEHNVRDIFGEDPTPKSKVRCQWELEKGARCHQVVNLESLGRHVGSHFKNKSSHMCTLCGKSFQRAYSYVRHLHKCESLMTLEARGIEGWVLTQRMCCPMRWSDWKIEKEGTKKRNKENKRKRVGAKDKSV